MRGIRRSSAAILLAAAALSACGGSAGDAPSTSAGDRPSTSAGSSTGASDAAGSGPSGTAGRIVSEDYAPGMNATIRVPPGSGPADVLVLVPGGSWTTADPGGLVPLAERLAAAGHVAVTITYGTRSTGATFPAPVDDVACGVRWAAARAARMGRAARRLVVVGHSAGGHLAALVTFSGRHFGATCPSAARAVDGFVGLAGVYRLADATDVAAPLFTAPPSAAATDWQQAEPTWWLRQDAVASKPRVLLLHGTADTAVPVSQTQRFAADLRAEGVEVTVRMLPGQDHSTVYEESVAGPEVEAWLGG